jgi:hypothetical protein
MALPEDHNVRLAIKGHIEIEAPKAIVNPYWTLDEIEVDSWPGELVSIANLPSRPGDNKRTHGYVITRFETDGQIVGGGQTPSKRVWEYIIFGMHYHDWTNYTTNSDRLFNAEIDRIVARFDGISKMPDSAAQLAGAQMETLLRFRIERGKYGGKLHHVAVGRFKLNPCE